MQWWLFDFIAQGGPVLYGILALCLVMWSLILERLWFFYIDLPKLAAVEGRCWKCRAQRDSWSAQKIRQACISRHKQAAEKNLSTIAILIAICPLMGLLGTVTGMIHVFDVLAATGTGNARAMADGISQATIPTMAGLVVALTGLYFNSRFKRLSNRAERKLADLLTTS